jgi:hypothetical protein
VLAQTTGFDRGKGETLGKFLCYAVSQGQVIAPELRYARLSAPLVEIAMDAISKIPGAPPKSSCFVAGAPRPPGLPDVSGPGGAGGGSSAEQAAAAAALKAQEEAAAEAAAKAAKKLRAQQARQVSLDSDLAAAAAGQGSGGGSTPTIWILLAGAVLAAGISAAVTVRRQKAVP